MRLMSKRRPGGQVDISTVKQFWDNRPCNVRHSQLPVGTREYFEEVEARKYFVEPHIPRFAQFERWRGKRVLEIGCGIGTDSISFARGGANLTAVDVSERSLDICRRRFDEFGLHADIRFANVERLSEFIEPEPYDLIYAFGVIHHTPSPTAAIKELRKFCGPNTEVRLMVYSKWSWKTAWIVLSKGRGAFWRAEELTRQYAEAQTGCPVAYTYTPRDIANLLEGFEIQSIQKDHIFPYRVDDYVQYRYRREWYFAVIPAPAFKWLEHRLGWHTLVVARPSSQLRKMEVTG